MASAASESLAVFESPQSPTASKPLSPGIGIPKVSETLAESSASGAPSEQLETSEQEEGSESHYQRADASGSTSETDRAFPGLGSKSSMFVENDKRSFFHEQSPSFEHERTGSSSGAEPTDGVQTLGESVLKTIHQYETDVRRILDAGVRYVVLTLGSQGVCVSHFETAEAATFGRGPESSEVGFQSSSFSLLPSQKAAPLLPSRLREKDERTAVSNQPTVVRGPVLVNRRNHALVDLSGVPRRAAPSEKYHPASAWGEASPRRIVQHHIPALPARVVGLTGAGDSVVAGAVAGLVTGQAVNPVQAAAFGVAAAKQTVESERNVPEGLSMDLIQG
jgi:hypothetical protein